MNVEIPARLQFFKFLWKDVNRGLITLVSRGLRSAAGSYSGFGMCSSEQRVNVLFLESHWRIFFVSGCRGITQI